MIVSHINHLLLNFKALWLSSKVQTRFKTEQKEDDVLLEVWERIDWRHEIDNKGLTLAKEAHEILISNNQQH